MDTKALRQKILDLAIRGKLVPQDPNDEPAAALLEKIREQKQQMVKEGKLKKKDIKNDSVIFVGEDNLHYEKFADGTVKCIEDEIPFELPDGWCWARLGSIANIVTGRLDANAQTKDGAYPFFTCGEEVFKTDSYAFDCNAILLGGNNATGDFKMHKFSGKFNAYQRVYVITTFPEIDVDYLYNHIRYYLPRLQSQSIGSQTRYLKLGMITGLLIALPTFCEQKTISRACDKYINYCTEIASEKNELKRILKDTKSKILDLAIRGQLVPQNPDDEPASVLLGRIRAQKEELIKQGKSKRDKKESIIFKGEDNSYYEKNGSEVRCIDEEIPFELPDRWNWARLKTICSKIIDGSHNPPKGSGVKTPYIMVSSRNIIFDAVTDLENVRYLNEIDFERENSRSQLTINDVLLTTVATLGRSCIYNGFPENLCFQRSVTVITTDILPQYLKIFFDAPYFQNLIVNNATGTAQKGFYLNQLEGVLVCVPPTDEQKRLSTKVGQILTSIQRIEKSLS